MLREEVGTGWITVGADKPYTTAKLAAEARALNVTPHVTQNITERGDSTIDARTMGGRPATSLGR